MISLEQVRLLEEKVEKAIKYVERLTLENTRLSSDNLNLELKSNSLEVENKKLLEENKTLASEKASLVSKMEANQKRIDELEVHVLSFKEDQSRIEDGIIAALDRLSQFEEAFENSLKDTKPKERKTAIASHGQDKEKTEALPAEQDKEIFFEIPKSDEQNEEEAASLEAELDIF